jgi:hypothetical protein
MTAKLLVAYKVLFVLCGVGLPLCIVYYVPAKRLVASMGLPPWAVIVFIFVAAFLLWWRAGHSAG